MIQIIKTWPSFIPPTTTARIFSERSPFPDFYFTLGRGKPQRAIDELWFTYRGRILGSLKVHQVVRNDGSLPRLRRLDGGDSEWQIKPDAWVAICDSFVRVPERLYMPGFRGWRYFDYNSYRETPDSRIRI